MKLPKPKRELLLVPLSGAVLFFLVINLFFWDEFVNFYFNLRSVGKPIILVNQSSRMRIAFKNKESLGKVRKAVLFVWAKKLGVSAEELVVKLKRAERIEVPIRFLELDENCQQKSGMKEASVDLRKPVKLTVWDRACGLGSSNATRVQFRVQSKQLEILVYWVDNPPQTAMISGLIEGLEILFNDGRVNYSSEPLLPELESMLGQWQPGKIYEPEIVTLKQ